MLSEPWYRTASHKEWWQGDALHSHSVALYIYSQISVLRPKLLFGFKLARAQQIRSRPKLRNSPDGRAAALRMTQREIYHIGLNSPSVPMQLFDFTPADDEWEKENVAIEIKQWEKFRGVGASPYHQAHGANTVWHVENKQDSKGGAHAWLAVCVCLLISPTSAAS